MPQIANFQPSNSSDNLEISKGEFNKNQINAGDGIDTVVFNGNFKEWDIEMSYKSTGELDYILISEGNKIQQNISKIETGWNDWAKFYNFEIFKFNDKTVNLKDANKPQTALVNEQANDGLNSDNLSSNVKSNEFYAFGFNNNTLNSFSGSTLELTDENDIISMIGSGKNGLGTLKESKIKTYGGNDNIKIVAYGKAVISSDLDLGSGDDKVDVSISKIPPEGSTLYKYWLMPTYLGSKINLGDGDDWINVDFGLSSSFDGGKGTDIIVLQGNKNDYIVKEYGTKGSDGHYLQVIKNSVIQQLPEWSAFTESQKLEAGIKILNFEKIVFDDQISDYSTSGSSSKDATSNTAYSTGTAYDKYYSALTSGNASLVSKKINWKELDISTATSDFYQALDWKSVNMSLLQKFQSSGINWGKVQYQEFSVAQYTQTNWSLVNISQLSDTNYDSIDWGRVAYKGTKSINYSQLSWSKVDFGDFSVATFKQVDWSQVKTSDLTSEQYSEIKWGSVSFSGKTSINYSSLDWSQVITASGFNAAAYKSVNWAQVDFADFKQQTFATTNWNQVNFKQLSASQYQAINWNEINLGALSTKTYKSIDWKKVNVAAFDAESISTAKWSLMKGVTKPTAAAKPAEADFSFLGATTATGSSAALMGAGVQIDSSQVLIALKGDPQSQSILA